MTAETQIATAAQGVRSELTGKVTSARWKRPSWWKVRLVQHASTSGYSHHKSFMRTTKARSQAGRHRDHLFVPSALQAQTLDVKTC